MTGPPPAGTLRDLPAFWLRDNCGCADCRDPRNGQKLFQITDLPADLTIDSERTVLDGGNTVHEVRWLPDGHHSRYAQEWLDALGEPATEGDGRTEDAKQLWSAADFQDGQLPQAAWQDYLSEDAERLRVLDAVARSGFALLRGVPLLDGQVLAVAETFGFVRETNYGRLFDVRVEDSPNNLAFTSAAIAPHTDNPYRDPVPTLQLLHCLDNSAPGGDSGLVDGFAAAALLRAEDPDAFNTLTRTPVPFHFQDAHTRLRADQPLIGLDPRGRIREVRFNNRSTGTLRLPVDETAAFYTAYRAFGTLLLRPGLRLELRLARGDCLVFDNVRLLHARTAFEDRGSRHLQGCYADLDALASTRAVLRHAVGSAASEQCSLRTVRPGNEDSAMTATVSIEPLETLATLFEGEGAAEYFGEPVTQAQHMLQAAALARADGAPDALVAAALLHDVGHFEALTAEHGGLGGALLMAGTDNRHSHTGAQWLSRWFGHAVTEPVRLHVAAKRYLCAVEPGYFERLSEASRYTLTVQGGPMTPDQAAAFAAGAYAGDAVRLRRWDEAAKDPALDVPGFAAFAPLLAALVEAPGLIEAPAPGHRSEGG